VKPLWPFVRPHANGVVLSIKAQPRANRDEIAGVIADELKLKITAPPVDSAANAAIMAFLAELLDCPKSAVQLIRGQTSRHKQILLVGLTIETVTDKLRHHLE